MSRQNEFSFMIYFHNIISWANLSHSESHELWMSFPIVYRSIVSFSEANVKTIRIFVAIDLPSYSTSSLSCYLSLFRSIISNSGNNVKSIRIFFSFFYTKLFNSFSNFFSRSVHTNRNPTRRPYSRPCASTS